MELRDRAHAAADSVSPVLHQRTTGPLSLAFSKCYSHLLPLLISSLLHSSLLLCIGAEASQNFCCFFFLFRVPLCLSSSLSILSLQSPVDSDNENRALLPCSRFLCKLTCCSAVAIQALNLPAWSQHRCSYPLGQNKSRIFQSCLWMGHAPESESRRPPPLPQQWTQKAFLWEV